MASLSGRVWIVNSTGQCQTISMLVFTAILAHGLSFRGLSK